MQFTNYLLAGAALASAAFSLCVDYQLIEYIAEHPDLPGVAASIWLKFDGVECHRLIKEEDINPDKMWYAVSCDKEKYAAALSTDMKVLRWSAILEDEFVFDEAEITAECADVGFVPYVCDARGEFGC